MQKNWLNTDYLKRYIELSNELILYKKIMITLNVLTWFQKIGYYKISNSLFFTVSVIFYLHLPQYRFIILSVLR